MSNNYCKIWLPCSTPDVELKLRALINKSSTVTKRGFEPGLLITLLV